MEDFFFSIVVFKTLLSVTDLAKKLCFLSFPLLPWCMQQDTMDMF